MIEDSEWQMILGEVDINGDGEISFEEFQDMIFNLFGLERPTPPNSKSPVNNPAVIHRTS